MQDLSSRLKNAVAYKFVSRGNNLFWIVLCAEDLKFLRNILCRLSDAGCPIEACHSLDLKFYRCISIEEFRIQKITVKIAELVKLEFQVGIHCDRTEE